MRRGSSCRPRPGDPVGWSLPQDPNRRPGEGGSAALPCNFGLAGLRDPDYDRPRLGKSRVGGSHTEQGENRMRFVLTRAFGAVVIASFAVVLLAGATAFAGSNAAGGGGLSKHDRELLAQAEASGKDTVVLIIASKAGANRDVVRSIEAQGGSILNRDDSLGYVLARVATDKVQAIAALDSIEGIDLDEIISLEDPRPEGSVTPTPQTPPGAATPRVNAYMPTGDTGAAQFALSNPTFDGRGVTIGIVDLGVSLDHPSLTTTSTGERKIVDWVTGTHP